MLALCLLCSLLAEAWPASAAPVGSVEPAQHEELTLLFHGALQLGQALNGVYKSTDTRLTQARHSVRLYGRALGLLGREVSEGRDAAQELRASLQEMQVSAAVRPPRPPGWARTALGRRAGPPALRRGLPRKRGRPWNRAVPGLNSGMAQRHVGHPATLSLSPLCRWRRTLCSCRRRPRPRRWARWPRGSGGCGSTCDSWKPG